MVGIGCPLTVGAFWVRTERTRGLGSLTRPSIQHPSVPQPGEGIDPQAGPSTRSGAQIEGIESRVSILPGDRTARNEPAVPTDQAAGAPPSDGAPQPPEDLGPRPSWADKAWRDHPPCEASLGPLTGLCN